MKINLNLWGMGLGLGLVSMALCAGYQTSRANAETVQTLTNTAPPSVGASAPLPSASAVPTTPALEAFGLPSPATGAPAASASVAAPSTNGAILANSVAAAATVPLTNAPVVREAVVPGQLNLSPALTQVAQLLQGGVNSEVIMAYVTNSTQLFNVGPREILYLHDLGAPPSIITAMIQKDSTPEAQAQRRASTAVQPLPPGVALNTPATNIYPTTEPLPGPELVTNPPEPTPVAPPAGATTLSASVTNIVEPTEPVTVSYFESELSPYGSWVYVNGYGRCWRPTVSVWNADWRPYCDGGRWLWTDSGWYWYSDYSWGWAPFHYGRWFCPSGVGWVWYPDVHWGPSWVSWRYSAGYCGWAPLPPSAYWVHGYGFYHNSYSVGVGFEFGLGCHDYVFVSYDRFCDRRPSAHVVGHHRSRDVYNGTRVANNYGFKNNGVVNHGAGVETVNTITRGNVRKVALRDNGAVATRDSVSRREQLDAEGRTLAVTRPSANVLAARVPISESPTRPSRSSSEAVPVGSAPSSSLANGSRVPPTGTARGGSTLIPRSSPQPDGQSITRPSETVRRAESASTSQPLTTTPSTTASRPFVRPPSSTPAPNQVIRPYTRPSREPVIIAGGNNSGGQNNVSTPTPSRSVPPASIGTRPPGSVSGSSATITRPPGVTAGSVAPTPGPGSSVTVPSGTAVPRVSAPQSSGGGNMISRPSNPGPSRPAYSAPSVSPSRGGGGGGGNPRAEISRPSAPSRSEVSRPSTSTGGGNTGGGVRSSGGGTGRGGRGRD